jgi:curved DNA-binding protein CbpA
MTLTQPSLYEVFSLPPSASKAEIRAKYLELILLHHPDKKGDSSKSQEILKAWEVLGDESKRKEYDAILERTSSGNFLITSKEV